MFEEFQLFALCSFYKHSSFARYKFIALVGSLRDAFLPFEIPYYALSNSFFSVPMKSPSLACIQENVPHTRLEALSWKIISDLL